MSIPQNITKDHLIKAILKIDKEGIPNDGDSQYYDVVYNGRKYPPKVVVSYANIFANGEELDRNSFSGGLKTQCFKLLEENEFIIKKKSGEDIDAYFKIHNNMSYYNELKNFLVQAKTKSLRKKDYIKNFQDLTVKVGFGNGNQARIPWIAFLNDVDKVQDGIYPVYLYYKENDLLILAYGVSEKKKPSRFWNVSQGKTISEYFNENNLGKPKRYGSSIVFKSYNVNRNIIEKVINNDLNEIISIYKATNKKTKPNKEFIYRDIIQDISKAGLFFTERLIFRFTSSLLTKPFVILTGLSGSGKTKLAQAFAMWICEKDEQYCIVPVGADWTNREPLLGFPNALESNKYVKPDHKVLDLILNAIKYPCKPYFLILDEMNLSHVERYFADFLSVMETKKTISLHSGNGNENGVPSEKTISLHSGNGNENGVPSEVELPQNLFIIGTVNIDETTYMFSPKVLDRANVIEFRVTAEEIEEYLNKTGKVNLNELKSSGAGMAESFINIAKDESLKVLKTEDLEIIKPELKKFFVELKKTGAEFGYRSASEIMRFAAVINTLAPEWKAEEIIDVAIMQKLLPKVHGSRKKLEPVLKTLGELCLKELKDFEEIVKSEDENIYKDKGKYPVSLEKICRMYKNLMHNGFTSYAEA